MEVLIFMPETITCTECGMVYPATKQYFTYSKSKDKQRILLRKVCRKCFNAKSKDHYHNVVKSNQEMMEHRREYGRELRKTEVGREYHRSYKSAHREHLNELERNRVKANPEKARERKDRWLRNNKPKRLEVLRRYRANNADSIKESARKYRQTERGKELSRMFAQQRLAKKRELECTFTTEQWEECKEYFGHCCSYCGKHEDILEFVLEQDHFIALNNHGPYTKDNVVTACKECNISKNDHYFFNWYPRQSYYSAERENKILEYLNSQSKPIQQLSFVI